ncbi:hypothetical protein EYZ11_009675 [Aspergillus tanneri]|uniref:J domain-containing protein n=1 Tax=Aspergillus tanneri TaxID=1220188 RepID=A0A4S3J7R4_9EURO|nr:uncharacterized protein ATNIH1004_008935 [Aspergillus tanneri]KAA8644728.1 hypothetical protein ATNIH1004_008935 [Aspergillus tanneri]THC90862.1 hypothetical protein EYZ11_009675 [Aspergillus tanneri]
MSSAPDIDPYAVLGVQKDATLQEIRTAHRKLVLKCHPDKIKDESQRSKAQDEFQKVQQAYELLSDETRRIKHDQKVRLAELRREMMARGGMPRTGGPSAREYRDGRIYEERTPADTFDEDIPFVEEPRTMSRKYEEFGKRQRPKGTEDKKKTKSVPVSTRAAKETARDSAKATHSNRAKYRTKERRREAYEKYEQTYGESDDDGASDSSTSSIYVRVKRPSESRRARESSSRKPKPADSPRRANPLRYEEEDYADEWNKHDKLQSTARDYILRSRGTAPVEIDGRHRSSRSPLRHREYESAEPESSASRRSGRSARSSKETVRGTSRHGSYEHLEPQARSYEHKVPSMPTAATSPGIKGSSAARPSLYPSRSATTHSHSRSKRDSSRSDQVLLGMVYPDGPPRASKLRSTDRYDSGYSSPGTPEMTPGESPSKPSSTRYKIVTEPDTVVVEPSMLSPPHPSPRRTRTYSPPRQERPSRPAPKQVRSSAAYPYAPDPSSTRYEATRPSNSRQSSSRTLFNEVEYSTRVKDKDVKYAREIGPEHVIYTTRDTRDAYPRSHYDDYRNPLMGRRQSAYA